MSHAHEELVRLVQAMEARDASAGAIDTALFALPFRELLGIVWRVFIFKVRRKLGWDKPC